MSSIEDSVIDKIKARALAGYNTYGTTMEREDLTYTDWLLHFQEELLDAAIYVEKLIKVEDKASILVDKLSKLWVEEYSNWNK